MSHQDSTDRGINHHNLKGLLDFLLPEKAAECPRHGNATISPLALAAVAIATWGWAASRTLTQRVEEAVAAVKHLGWPNESVSRQGLLKALAHCGKPLAATVASHLFSQLRQLKGHWTTAGKVTFAIDGTKFAAPRSQQNQTCFAAKSGGQTPQTNRKGKKYKSQADAKKANSVQIMLTVFWHIGSGLPACWRLTGSHGSERKQAEEMLGELPAGSRVVGDAEYIGYPLWSAILASGHSFVVRVGSNVTLLQKLEPKTKRKGNVVYCWPESVKKRGLPPLVLRLLTVQTAKGNMCLVTNEFALTDNQICELYRSRWSIEVFFRTVKQNCRRAKLLCQTPANVQTELTWTLLGIWSALFVAKLALHESRQPIKTLSPIRVIDTLGRSLTLAGLGLPGDFDLAACIKADESERISSKKSRDYPRKKKHRSCGLPKLRDATPDEVKAARKLLQ